LLVRIPWSTRTPRYARSWIQKDSSYSSDHNFRIDKKQAEHGTAASPSAAYNTASCLTLLELQGLDSDSANGMTILHFCVILTRLSVALADAAFESQWPQEPADLGRFKVQEEVCSYSYSDVQARLTVKAIYQAFLQPQEISER